MTEPNGAQDTGSRADVLLLTAVRDELDTILDLDDAWTAGTDSSGYRIHRRSDDQGRVWILARATAMGTEFAAGLATRLIAEFRPRCLAMVGVCAGWRDKVDLGDVVVADRLFRYDAGKLVARVVGESQETEIFHDIKTYNLDERWKQKAEELSASWAPARWRHAKPARLDLQEHWLLTALAAGAAPDAGAVYCRPDRPESCPDWTEVVARLERKGLAEVAAGLRLTDAGRAFIADLAVRCPDGPPPAAPGAGVHVGAIATGSRVIEDERLFPTISRLARGVRGLDMEGSAVAAVAAIEGVRHCLVAKGVSDHADPDKDDRFRPFAIEAAYRFVVELVGGMLEPAARQAPFILPQGDDPAFTGRGGELDQLRDSLLGGSGGRVSSIAGVSGTGGIGKSALAVHFAARYRDRFPDGVIGLRVGGKEPEELSRAFARLIGIAVDPDDERSAAEIMQAAFGPRKCLLIFDNADRASIRDLIPGGPTRVIVTTRDRGLPIALAIPPAGRVDVPQLPDEEALDLLRVEHGGRIDRELAGARRLVTSVGGLPLALQVISAILALEPWRPLRALAVELEAERSRLGALAVEGIDHLDVRASFNLSLARMTGAEADVFAAASVCDPAGFSVRAAAAASGLAAEEAARMLSRLRRFSVLNDIPGKSPPRFVFHPLMLEFAREAAHERGIAGGAAARHARYFAGYFAIHPFGDADNGEAAAELGEAVIAALCLAAEGVFDTSFLISLQGWLDRTAMWHDAVRVLEAYHRKREALDGDTRLQIANQYAKFLVRTGNFSVAAQIAGQAIPIDQDSLRPERTEAAILTTYGGALQRQGRFDEAVGAFEKAARIEELLENPRGQAMVLNSLGGVLHRQGNFDKAVEVFKDAAAIEERIGNRRGLAMVLNSLGGVLQRQGKFDEALEALERSHILLAAEGDERGVAMVLNSLGGVLQRQGKFDAAVEAFERARQIAESLADMRGLSMVLNSLGGVLQRQGKYDLAVKEFERSRQIREDLQDERGLAMVLNSLGGVLQRQGKFTKAAEAFERSRGISERAGDERGLAIVLNSIGGVLQRQGKFDEAVEAFEQSMRLCEHHDDGPGLSKILNSLGGALQRQGRFAEAVQAFERAMQISERLRDPRSLSMILNSLGGVLQRQGRLEDAVAAFRRARKISEDLGDERGLAMVLNSLGGVLQREGNYEEAIAAFEQSRRICTARGDDQSLAMVLNSLGGLLQRQGKFGEAVDALESARQISERLGDRRGQAMVLNSLGGAYQRIGRIEEADAAFRASIDLGDRLKDRSHLAKVHTAFGKALLQRGATEQAIEELGVGFALDERAANRRGIRFVAQPLVDALQRAGREAEAAGIVARALAVAPGDAALQRLRDDPQAGQGGGGGARATGRIKRLLEPMGRPRFGFIVPDGGGADIYFSERRIGSDLFARLEQGMRVTATVVETVRGCEARSVSPEA